MVVAGAAVGFMYLPYLPYFDIGAMVVVGPVVVVAGTGVKPDGAGAMADAPAARTAAATVARRKATIVEFEEFVGTGEFLSLVTLSVVTAGSIVTKSFPVSLYSAIARKVRNGEAQFPHWPARQSWQ